MFSGRLAGESGPNALTQLCESKSAEGRAVLDLTATNPTAAGFSFYDTLDPGILADPAVLSYVPNPFGPLATRESLCREYYGKRDGDFNPAHMILTASSSEAYGWLFKLLCNPGDDLLVPAPGYPLFSLLASLESVQTHSYPLTFSEGRWKLDIPRLRNAIGTRTRAICAVSPNNPTGSFLSAAELAELCELCAEFNLALIVDEVFADYRSADHDPVGSPSALGSNTCLTFVLSGFSKVLCLPQLKLGWIAVSGPDALRTEALRRLEFIADAYLPVNAPVALAVPALLDFRDMIQKEVKARLDRNETLLRDLSATGLFDVLPREGGWYACIRIQRESAPFSLLLLEHQNVLVHPGFYYDFPADDILVLSLLCDPDVFFAGIGLIVSSLNTNTNTNAFGRGRAP